MLAVPDKNLARLVRIINGYQGEGDYFVRINTIFATTTGRESIFFFFFSEREKERLLSVEIGIKRLTGLARKSGVGRQARKTKHRLANATQCSSSSDEWK